jgi:hypothetical protein
MLNGVITIDPDAQSVLEFMQARIPVDKLVSIADSLPQMARLLWGHYPQRPCHLIGLEVPKTSNLSQSTANEYVPVPACVGGGFEGARNGL